MGRLIKDENGIIISPSIKGKKHDDAGNFHRERLQQDSFWFNHRNKIILEIIKKCPFKGNFVDIGGGNGQQVKLLSQRFKNRNFFLVEPSYVGCQYAKRNGLEYVFNMDFTKFPVDKYQIGGVGLFDVIEHIKNDGKFLQSVASRLHKDSLIYITVPANQFLWSDVDCFASHQRRYDRKTIIKLARECKLKIVYLTYFFSYLPILIFLLRKLPYLIRGTRSNKEIIRAEYQQHKTNVFVNYMVNRVNKWEINKIKEKTINFGASLAVIFTKI